MAKEWSKYQLDFFDAYENTRSNLFVKATAGSSKTTSMLECLKRTSPVKKKIFLAFNKSISEELKERVPAGTETSTFHSKGLKILLQNFRLKFKVNENKAFSICRKILELNDIPVKQQTRYIFELQEIWNQIRVNLCVDYPKDIPFICIEKDIEFKERMIDDIEALEKEWHKGIKKLSQGEFQIDFTDMLWVPYILLNEEAFPKYDIVFIDEGQDLNTLQTEIALRLVKPKRGRFVVVGDEAQCQPEGTKVLMDDGTKKNIEDIQVGDVVVSYEYRHDNCFVCNYERIREKSPSQYQKVHEASKSKVLRVAVRDYEDYLYKLSIGDMESSYTPEHICYVRWKPEIRKKYVLYLMQKGDWFRIGITPYCSSNNHSGGLLFRFNCENADKLWILNFYDNKRDARIDEMFFSYKYGIPQTIFEQRTSSDSILGQEGIVEFFDRFEGCLEEKSIELLTLFSRKINCPFLSRNKEDSRWKAGTSYMFNTYACNIFPELMQVIIYDGFNYEKTSRGTRAKPVYKNIEKWEKIMYMGKVYSLEIGWNQNYVADGILTHNCIYGFQGASLNNFLTLQSIPNTITLPLSITYRCSKRIVEEAKTVFPNEIEAAPWAEEGIVRRGDLGEAQSGDFVLCRNNLPLVAAFVVFLRLKKKAVIKGKDLGQSLLSILDKITEIKDLDTLLEAKLEELLKKGISRAAALNNPSYIALEEKAMIIRLLHKEFPSITELYSVIDRIFTEDTGEGVILCTCHKSKGLEADRVFFLNPELIPSQYATTEKALYGEKCLKFVAITRARKELVYCNI